MLTFSLNWPEVMRIEPVSFVGYRIAKERLLGTMKVLMLPLWELVERVKISKTRLFFQKRKRDNSEINERSKRTLN